MVNFLNNFKRDVKKNVPGFIAVSIIEVATGVCYVSYSDREGFDSELASTYDLEVAKVETRALKTLGIKGEIRGISITLTDQIHILDLSNNGEYFIYLALDRTEADLDVTRELLKDYRRDIANEFDFEVYMRQIATTSKKAIC